MGTGALKRRLPTGACAKGIPSHLSRPVAVLVTPTNFPEVRFTWSGSTALTETLGLNRKNSKHERPLTRIMLEAGR
jgi:hypothetical protein